MDQQQQNSGIGSLFSRLWGRPSAKQTADEESIMRAFVWLLMNFKKRMFDLNSKWTRIIRYNELLANPETKELSLSIIEKGKRRGWLEVYHKRWIALRLALELYKKLDESTQAFYSSKQDFTAKIIELYPELGKKIESFTLSEQNKVLIILNPIIKVINNPPLVISYIVKHYDELIQKIGRLDGQKTSNKLMRAIIVLSNKEIEELNKCITDVRSWPYMGAYGISLFIERSYLYLCGGKSRYDGESFLGFNMYFRDEELVRELRTNAEIKKLMTYMEELNFFSEARYAIKKSVETQGKWEGFYDFYNNLERGKNYIGMFRDKFGNEEFAKLLEVFREKKHEAPIDWENELAELGERLVKQSYQLVIEPAGNALIRTFGTAIKKLEKNKETAVGDLKKILAEGNEIPKMKRQFLKIVAGTRILLRKELEEERLEFQALLQDVMPLMPKMNSLFLTALEMSDPTNQMGDTLKIFDSYVQWGEFASANLRLLQQPDDRLENDETVRAITAAIASFQKESILASQGINLKNKIVKNNEIGYKMLAQATRIIEEEIKPKLSKCDNHMGLRLGVYTKKLNYYLNGDIQKQSVSKADLRAN